MHGNSSARRPKGVGFSCASVQALGQLFSTSKAYDTAVGGVFGIGLKMVVDNGSFVPSPLHPTIGLSRP